MSSTNSAANINIEEWLKPILEKEGLESYTVEVSGNTEKGDGYLGDITFVEVDGLTKNKEKRNFNFVIKSGKRSKDLRDMIPVRKAFENEIFFYNEIFPVLVQFQKEKGVQDPFNNVAKCYGTLILEEMEILILENLRKRGYSLHNRYNPMNKEHIRKVIKLYGKLHAISFALRDQKPEIFRKLTKNLADIFKLSSEKVKPPENHNVYQFIIDLAKEENDSAVVDKAYFLNERVKTLNDLTDPSDPYAVILHGDCWNNNFMFKYVNDQETISDICFLDFQLTRLASPVYDLSYFLFTCISGEDVQNFDEINSLYYETLSNSLKAMGSDPNKMFPYEELLKQWKKFSLFGLMMMPGLVKASLSEKDEVNDLEELAKSEDGFKNAFKTSVKNVEQYRQRTLPVMRLTIKKQFVE